MSTHIWLQSYVAINNFQITTLVIMSDLCVLDGGICKQCKLQVEDNEVIKCFKCSTDFHALCKTASSMICNKSLLNVFMQRSTKRNFIWVCDTCLTEVELMNTESQVSESTKVKVLENKIDLLFAKVDSLSDVMTANNSNANSPVIAGQAVQTSNPWKNTSKVTIMKNSLESSLDLGQLEKRIVHDKVQVTSSKRNKKGDIIITCPNSTSASQVKNLAAELLPDHTVSDPSIKGGGTSPKFF